VNFSAFMFTLDREKNPTLVERAPVFEDRVYLRADIELWLEENLNGLFEYRAGERTVTLLFKRKEDAAMFKLFWL